MSGRIIFVNRFFHPDESATSQILSDLAFHLASRGRETHVIACGQLYGDASARLPSEEVLAGVHIHRIGATRFGRGKLFGRAIDYLSFYISSFIKVATVARRGDLVVAKTDPPLLSIPIGAAARLRGAKCVNWLQDVFPEVASMLGVPLTKGILGRVLAGWRDASLRRAAHNIVIGETMAQRLVWRGLPPEQMTVVHNWSDDEEIAPLARDANHLRAEWGLGDLFVVGYSGGLGRAHEWETLIGAARLLRSAGNVKFLFIGGGHHMMGLRDRVSQLGLDDLFLFKPYQDRKMLKYSLCVPDAHWVSLRPELEGLIVPSKFYGILAAGRPVLAVAAADGEVARMTREAQCGFVVEPGDSQALYHAIAKMTADAELTAQLGARARRALEMQFRRASALARWEALIARMI